MYMNAYVIGSIKQADDIKRVADSLMSNFNVRYVKPEPDIPLSDLIHNCYRNISEADFVFAVQKPDGTFGEGVTYEIEFAYFLGKNILKIKDVDKFIKEDK